MTKGLIFDVKRYAINDGPGIRVVIFFKGCNLNCVWCHNPEGISGKIEKMYSPAKCIKCGICVAACPVKALTLTQEGIVTDKALCILCGKCAEVCPAKAIEMSGYYTTVAALMDIIEKERIFFDQSGGGVTFSGGEPLLQPEFLMELLDECGRRGIHRAIDTAGLVDARVLLDVAKRTDLFLFDLKMMDSARHKEWTNTGNEKILGNLKALAEAGANIIVRIPVIEGVNDDDANIEETAKFIARLAGEKKQVNLIPYHPIAQTKYQRLGKPGDFKRLREPGKKNLERIVMKFGDYGVNAKIGG